MWVVRVVLCLAILCFCGVNSSPQLCADPPTVTSLNVTQYMGVWYQIAADPFVLNTTERGYVCLLANYTLLNSTTIGVFNFARYKTVDGPTDIITGYAQGKDASHPGRLTVYLEGVPFGGPYWILTVGPVVDDQYSYAVVSDSLCLDLYVLARTQTIDAETETTIKSFLTKLGFDVQKKYVPVLQEGCVY
eukprot:Phypoly_transcript_18590.p1 GENE.Phypoly_transcript_18590~~Phypoly_transcript_18590.p1  ORF type:complete len:190 (+),score=11.63 Phypoly_transcript_18590:172-741(+)